jgi:hypothetical protein
MVAFIHEMKQHMKGTDYITHVFDWDGKLPLMNLCVFDRSQVFITVSTESHENPYIPITGVRIRSAAMAEFLYHEYYRRLVSCCMTET